MKLTPGNLLTDNVRQDSSHLGRQDAFHVPCIAVTCDEMVYASEGVCFTDESLTTVRKCRDNSHHAIVDPFLEDGAGYGDCFWVFLLPGVVNNLTHNFEVDLKLTTEQLELEQELQHQKDKDPNCTECWHIKDGKISRD